MRNWSPEPFLVDPEAVVRTSTPSDGFVRTSPADAAADIVTAYEPLAWTAVPDQLDGLSDQENLVRRTAAYDQARADLQEAFAAERRTIEAAHAAEMARSREESSTGFAAWAKAFTAAVARRRYQEAPQMARLALAMAEKIVRATVEADPSVLVRTIETILFKIEREVPLTVTVHPDDAAWLEDHAETAAELRIGEIVADRRISRGGCRVRAAGREWDASLESQLQAMADAVAAALDHGEGGHHAP